MDFVYKYTAKHLGSQFAYILPCMSQRVEHSFIFQVLFSMEIKNVAKRGHIKSQKGPYHSRRYKPLKLFQYPFLYIRGVFSSI